MHFPGKLRIFRSFIIVTLSIIILISTQSRGIFNPLSASPKKWSNSLKLTVFWGWRLKGYDPIKHLCWRVLRKELTAISRKLFSQNVHTRTCAYQEERNVSFSENFAYALNELSHSGWSFQNSNGCKPTKTSVEITRDFEFWDVRSERSSRNEI